MFADSLGNDDFWIDMAREEMAAIQRRADEDKLAINCLPPECLP